jgi:hypothetical protein
VRKATYAACTFVISATIAINSFEAKDRESPQGVQRHAPRFESRTFETLAIRTRYIRLQSPSLSPGQNDRNCKYWTAPMTAVVSNVFRLNHWSNIRSVVWTYLHVSNLNVLGREKLHWKTFSLLGRGFDSHLDQAIFQLIIYSFSSVNFFILHSIIPFHFPFLTCFNMPPYLVSYPDSVYTTWNLTWMKTQLSNDNFQVCSLHGLRGIKGIHDHFSVIIFHWKLCVFYYMDNGVLLGSVVRRPDIALSTG